MMSDDGVKHWKDKYARLLHALGNQTIEAPPSHDFYGWPYTMDSNGREWINRNAAESGNPLRWKIHHLLHHVGEMEYWLKTNNQDRIRFALSHCNEVLQTLATMVET